MEFCHIIDHEGFGTIHRLLIPLCEKYKNHKLYTPYSHGNDLKEKIIKNINRKNNCIIVIHSTGRIKSCIMQNFNILFPNKKIFIFLHTSYAYQCFKNRDNNIKYYKFIECKYNVSFLVPSKEVKKQYQNAGLKQISVVQLGIPDIEKKEEYKKYRIDLEKYYNKIVTTCSSSNKDYLFIKGIDLYKKFIINNNLFSESLVAGIDSIGENRILTKKFNVDDFLNVLYHSKVYIQLSRYESYNITAIQAKRFKKGIFLLGCEGNKSCMNEFIYNDIFSLENDILLFLNHEKQFLNEINLSYSDSVKRESLENFKISLERVVK